MADRCITALKAQKKNPNRISIYLDGEFAFGVSRIVAAWLKIGQVLNEEKIQSLQQDETREAALQRALLLLSYRPRSEAEIREKLTRAGFEPDVIAGAIERLRSSGLVQDETFAQTWIENRSTFRPRSQKMLAYELRRKGVAEDTIQRTLLEGEDDSSLAYQAAVRYATRLDETDWQEFRRRLTAFLARRGFSYSTAAPIVIQVWQELHPGVENVEPLDQEDE
jgi:regulatory protein